MDKYEFKLAIWGYYNHPAALVWSNFNITIRQNGNFRLRLRKLNPAPLVNIGKL
jgi:hypothetical protein